MFYAKINLKYKLSEQITTALTMLVVVYSFKLYITSNSSKEKSHLAESDCKATKLHGIIILFSIFICLKWQKKSCQAVLVERQTAILLNFHFYLCWTWVRLAADEALGGAGGCVYDRVECEGAMGFFSMVHIIREADSLAWTEQQCRNRPVVLWWKQSGGNSLHSREHFPGTWCVFWVSVFCAVWPP